MSKVVHLSDDAHNKAKAFCKTHSLKMSDWVAALIEEAIASGRTDPTIKVRAVAPPPPPPPQPVAHTISAPASMSVNTPSKKKLERYEERHHHAAPAPAPAEQSSVPPWAAPPFWAQQKAHTK